MKSSNVVIEVGEKKYTFPSPLEVHALAVEKGWYDKYPNSDNKELITLKTMDDFFIPAQLGMIQSEAIEALTATEDSEQLIEELADTLLRSFDLMAFLSKSKRKIPYYHVTFPRCNLDIEKTINLSFIVNKALRNYRSLGVKSVKDSLFSIVSMAIAIAEHFNLNLEKAVADKHEFNKTRPYRHGNKLI